MGLEFLIMYTDDLPEEHRMCTKRYEFSTLSPYEGNDVAKFVVAAREYVSVVSLLECWSTYNIQLNLKPPWDLRN